MKSQALLEATNYAIMMNTAKSELLIVSRTCGLGNMLQSVLVDSTLAPVFAMRQPQPAADRVNASGNSVLDVFLQGLSAFSRLTALTRISITDVALNDEALEGIAACTQLQDLILHNKKDPDTEVSVAGLMHLTRLTVLERLVVRVVIIDRIYRLRMVSSQTSNSPLVVTSG